MGNGARSGTEAPAYGESRRQQRLLRPTATAPVLDSTIPSACGPSPEVSRAFRAGCGGLRAGVSPDPHPCPSVPTSARRAGRKVGRAPQRRSRPEAEGACHFRSQSTKTRRPVTLKQNNPMLLYFNHLHLSTPSQRPEKPGPACYNANRKSSRTSDPTKEEGQKVGTAKALTACDGETPGGARLQTCRVAIRGDMSWRHDHSPTSAPSQPSLDLSGGERGAK